MTAVSLAERPMVFTKLETDEEQNLEPVALDEGSGVNDGRLLPEQPGGRSFSLVRHAQWPSREG